MASTQPGMILMLHKLRSAHIRWRSYAYGIINGLQVPEVQAPVDHKLCTFGEWYYGPGERHFGRYPSFAALDEAHQVMHLIYADIYKSVLLGKHDSMIEQKERFGDASRRLLNVLDALESEVTHGLPPSDKQVGEWERTR